MFPFVSTTWGDGQQDELLAFHMMVEVYDDPDEMETFAVVDFWGFELKVSYLYTTPDGWVADTPFGPFLLGPADCARVSTALQAGIDLVGPGRLPRPLQLL